MRQDIRSLTLAHALSWKTRYTRSSPIPFLCLTPLTCLHPHTIAQVLRLRVYDWDAFSSDDLIGTAAVPLAGVLEYGTIDAQLSLREEEVARHMRQNQKPASTSRGGTGASFSLRCEKFMNVSFMLYDT